MPILPGNLGNLPLLGFGMWTLPVVSAILESALITVGAFLYFRSVLSRAKSVDPNQDNRKRKIWAVTSGVVMAILLAISLITDVAGVG